MDETIDAMDEWYWMIGYKTNIFSNNMSGNSAKIESLKLIWVCLKTGVYLKFEQI